MAAITVPARPRFFRPTHRTGATIFIGILGTLNTTAIAQDAAPPAALTPVQADPAPPADPVEAALTRLRAGDETAETEIDRLLRTPDATAQILTSLSTFERVPLSLWRAISALTTPDQSEATRLLAAAVVPRFGSRDAAVRLIALLDDPSPVVADRSRSALTDLTGYGVDWDAARWRAWGAEAAAWSDRTWTSMVSSRLSARVRTQQERQRLLTDELVALNRRLHVELDPAGRTTLLAELIRDERAPLRDLGFDLAGRDLSARTQLGPELALAATARLAHPDPGTRAKAATLVSRLVPPDAMLTLTKALQAETSPVAAEPLLLGVARWPSQEALAPTIAWLDRPDAPFAAVCTALWAFFQGGHLEDPPTREKVVTAVRARELPKAGEAGMKLLVRLGGLDDLERVSTLLATGDDPSRSAAANALAETPDGTARLLESAAQDPRLFPAAARAIGTHRRSAEGLLAVASLPALDAAVKESAVLEAARHLPDDILGPAVRAANLPPETVDRALDRLLDPDTERSLGVLDGLILLAEARLALSRTNAAFEILAEIDDSALSPEMLGVSRRARALCLLRLRDLAGATAIGLALADWLHVWRLLDPGSAVQTGVAGFILSRFGPELEDGLRQEILSAIPREDPSTSFQDSAAPLEADEDDEETRDASDEAGPPDGPPF